MSTSTPRVARAVPLTGARRVLADYFELTKPKVQSLLLLTTITTMEIAGSPPVSKIALTCLGGYLSAGGAGAVNHWFDRDIDAQMKRTADAADPRRADLTAGGADVRDRARGALVHPDVADDQRAGRIAGVRRLRRLRRRLHDVA